MCCYIFSSFERRFHGNIIAIIINHFHETTFVSCFGLSVAKVGGKFKLVILLVSLCFTFSLASLVFQLVFEFLLHQQVLNPLSEL